MLAFSTHEQWLIAISAILATVIALKALDLAGRVRWMHRIGQRQLATASVVFGSLAWLFDQGLIYAFSLPNPDPPIDVALILLALILGIGVTVGAFFALNRGAGSPRVLGLGGLFFGVGLSAMHYAGLSARETALGISHSALWIGASVIVAIAGGTIALWLGFRNAGTHSKIAAAILVALTLAGIHYAAMQGAFYVQDPGPTRTALDAVQIAIGFVVAALLILFLASLSAMLDRRFAVLAEREAETLRRSEERFRHRYSLTPLPLHALSVEGRIDHVSDAWLELLGYDRSEVIGRLLVEFMTEESATRRVTDWERLKREGILRDVEYHIVAKSGEIRDVVLSSRAERDEDGTFTGALGGVVDITARRRAEAALRHAQKIEAIGQLTGGVAHDFNNLLAVILGNLEMIRKRLPEDPRLLRQVDNAMQATQRGASLTQRMLSFARRQDLKPEAVDVGRLVQSMGNLLQNAAGSENAIQLSFDTSLPQALVDANQLELSLLNLAVNARDAMGSGGTLTLSARAETVAAGAIDGLKAGSYVCLSVTDTGCGMDEPTLARAREPFFTTKGVGKGTGLGLSMVHGLAEQSGGSLVLKSQPGAGTTAEIWLPVAIAESSCALVQPLQAAAVQIEPIRVLVVDDDDLVLLNTVAMLEDLGHAVTSASSGREALEIFKRQDRFDLVMTDQAMPHMTGVQFATQVRALAPQQPIILASGYAEVPEGTALDLPRLRKPFEQATMARLIAETVPVRAVDRQVVPFRARSAG